MYLTVDQCGWMGVYVGRGSSGSRWERMLIFTSITFEWTRVGDFRLVAENALSVCTFMNGALLGVACSLNNVESEYTVVVMYLFYYPTHKRTS